MTTADKFKWSLRARTINKGLAMVYVRKHRFEVGVPLQFDEEYGQITALEYFLGAIGADVVNGLQAQARTRRIDIDNVEALVNGNLNNALTFLGVVGEEGHPGLEKLTIKVYVSSAENEEKVKLVWDETLRRSPLLNTLGTTINMELSIRVVT